LWRWLAQRDRTSDVNQIEIWFSIVHRKVLPPAAADSVAELDARIPAFDAECRLQTWPIRWKFTSEEFDRRLQELKSCASQLAARVNGHDNKLGRSPVPEHVAHPVRRGAAGAWSVPG
jgi:hypothetical protein